jgi:hypothetical protein
MTNSTLSIILLAILVMSVMPDSCFLQVDGLVTVKN